MSGSWVHLRTLRACLLLTALCFAASGVAEIRTLSIQGTVKDREARPIPGARVQIDNPERDEVIADTQSDAEGNFLIVNLELAPGQYTVKASRLGFSDDHAELTVGAKTSETQRFALVLGPPVIPRGPRPKEPYVVVQVFYATDRQDASSPKLGATYLNTRATDGKLRFGSCDVSIPRTHRLAEIELPSFWRFEFRPDPDKHVVLQKVQPESKEDFFAQVGKQVGGSKSKDAFVFIHGYDVSFEDAAQRTAQLAYDLHFQGAPIFYDWPSQARLFGYWDDEKTIPLTVENLKGFLRDLAQRAGASRIHLIAHSMGNRALLPALQQLEGDSSFKNATEFRQIVLAAPDVDRDVFIALAKEIARPDNRMTLYVSSKDQALLVSHKLFHTQPRAGEAVPNPIILSGVDTIDVSGVNTDMLGHSYYGDSQSVVGDLLRIFDGERAPRPGLSKASIGALAYWIMRAKQ